MSKLAMVYGNLGRLVDAAALKAKVLEQSRRVLPADDYRIGDSLMLCVTVTTHDVRH
jgi:hypothetical protein